MNVTELICESVMKKFLALTERKVKTFLYFETSSGPLDPNLWTESQNTFPVRMKEQIKHIVDDVLASATSVSDFWLENERFSRKQQTYITLFQKLLTNRCAIKGHLIEHDLTTLKMSVKFSLWIISRGLWELFVLSAHWVHEGIWQPVLLFKWKRDLEHRVSTCTLHEMLKVRALALTLLLNCGDIHSQCSVIWSFSEK